MKQLCFLIILLLHSVSVLSSPLRGDRRGATNPNNGKAIVNILDASITKANLKVFDVAGKMVFSSNNANNEDVKRINLELNNGIYLLQITDSDNGKTYKHKFVVQH